MYISDSYNDRVQEVAFTGHAEWGQPMIAADVYTIAGTAGVVGHSGDGGAATSADLNNPGSIAVSTGGNLYIADSSNQEIREVSAATYVISDVAGGVGTFAQDGDGGPATTSGLDQPAGIASDARGDIFVADYTGNRVQEIAASGHVQFGITMTAGHVYTVAGQAAGYGGTGGDGGPATAAYLDQPSGVAVDTAGDLYIADF